MTTTTAKEVYPLQGHVNDDDDANIQTMKLTLPSSIQMPTTMMTTVTHAYEGRTTTNDSCNDARNRFCFIATSSSADNDDDNENDARKRSNIKKQC